VATILDPRYKMDAYDGLCWAQEYQDMGKKFVEEALAKATPPAQSPNADILDEDETEAFEGNVLLRLQKAIKRRKTSSEVDELTIYLSESNVVGEDEETAFSYWRLNEPRFPLLSSLARDYLSIPVASVDIEREFSKARHMLPYTRGRMEKETIRRCMILKGFQHVYLDG
jgi:hypothetical protein